MKLFQVLGNVDIPKDELKFGLKLFDSPDLHRWEYRDPRGVRNHRNGTEWHKDAVGAISALALWTNVYPTEIKLPDGNIVSAEPNDVVLIDNKRVEHRTPLEYFWDHSGVRRDFLRLWVDRYPTHRQIEQWKQSIRDKQALWHLRDKEE